MESELPVTNLDRSRVAFRSLMLRMAVCNNEKLDLRSVLSLQQHGLLRKAKASPLPVDTAAIVADLNHERRVPAPLGPFLFVSEGPRKRAVLDVPEYLLSADQVMRCAALAHFERFAEHESITSRTRAILTDRSGEIMRLDPLSWRPAAIAAYDAVRSDYLCNLVGLRQSFEMQFDEGMEAMLRCVLEPSGESAQGLGIVFGDPVEQREEIARAVAKLAGSTNSIPEILEEYFSRLGHLPLCASLSMSAIIASRVPIGADHDALWKQLWTWANKGGSPLRRYHLCQIYCRSPHLVPAEHVDALWDELAAIVDIESEPDTGSLSEAWRIRCGLARHFCHYCSYTFQGHSGDRIADLSWWLAERVATALGKSQLDPRQVREGIVAREVELSSFVWQLVHPASKPSRLAYATTLVRSPWSLAIICQLDTLIRHFGTDRITPTSHAKLQAGLHASVIGMFPWLALKSESEVYAFDSGAIPTANAWVASSGAGEGRDLLGALLQANEKIRTTDDIGEQVAKSVEQGQTEELLVAGAFRSWVYQHEEGFERLWDTVSKREWGDQVFLKGDHRMIELVFEALNEVCSRGGEKWSAHLPHLFALYCQRAVDEPEREALLFAFTMFASLSSNGLSAIDRLVRSRTGQDYAASIARWRENLAGIQTTVPPWIAARIGAALLALRGTSPGG